MKNNKFKDLKFNFPDDPNDMIFIQMLKETVKRADFNLIKKEVLLSEQLSELKRRNEHE